MAVRRWRCARCRTVITVPNAPNVCPVQGCDSTQFEQVVRG